MGTTCLTHDADLLNSKGIRATNPLLRGNLDAIRLGALLAEPGHINGTESRPIKQMKSEYRKRGRSGEVCCQKQK